MSTDQAAFSFDSPLITEPVSQIVTKPLVDKAALLDRLTAILPELADDIDIDAPLLAIGLARDSLTGWHRARVMEVLVAGPYPAFQAYTTDVLQNGGLRLRYRRNPPLEACPGYGDWVCGKPTIGGKRCAECREIEEMDLWDQP